MKIIISNSSSMPIYLQIKNAFISQIISGELQENECIPSIRQLAEDIKISVMTIKKAYDELETEGYIKTIHGKGSFDSSRNNEMIKEHARKEIEHHLNSVIELSKKYDIKNKELIDLLQFLLESE